MEVGGVMNSQTAERLPKAEERYRALFNALDQGFCIIEVLFDPDRRANDYRFLEVNSAFEQQSGLKNAEGRRMRELAPTHEELWFEVYGRVALTGKPSRFINRAEALDRWFDVYAFRVGEAESHTVGILFTDITERRAADEAVRTSEELLRRILESATDYAIVVSDLDRIVTNWNAGAERLLGYTEEEIVGQRADIFFVPEDRAKHAPEREATMALENGRATNERWHLRKNGTRFWGSGFMFPLLEDGGKARGLLKIMRDRTAERQAEQGLQESEEGLRIAVESAQLGTWRYDEATGAVEANERCRQLFNIRDESESFYENFIKAVHPEDRERVHARVQSALRGEEKGVYRDEYRVLDPVGMERWIRTWGQAHSNSTGRSVRFTGTVLDVTEMARARQVLARRGEELERTVEQRTAELRDTVQQLETFSYSVVHDMRAPLRAMRSFANLLAEEYGPQLDHQARSYLTRIRESAARMDALITDVLSYSRVSSVEAVQSRVNLDVLAHEVVEQYPEFQSCADCFVIVSPLPAVLGNRALLTQCFSNLLGNAIKFVPPGRHPRVVVRAEKTASRVRVWVEDNGIGIPPEFRERIFGLFQRLHSQNEYSGTGVGLAIVKRAVERMNGAVGVESKPGEGSRFWMELDAAEQR